MSKIRRAMAGHGGHRLDGEGASGGRGPSGSLGEHAHPLRAHEGQTAKINDELKIPIPDQSVQDTGQARRSGDVHVSEDRHLRYSGIEGEVQHEVLDRIAVHL